MSNPSESRKDSRIKGFSELMTIGKDLFALLRDLSLFTLAFLLVLLPTQFNQILVNAGFEEGSLVGFKWKKQLAKTDSNLQEALATINDLKNKNEELTKALSESQSKINDPELKQRIAELEKENKKLNTATQKVEKSVTNNLASNMPFIDKASTTLASKQWGVVYGGDTTLKSANYETTTIATKYKIPNPQIYFRQGSFRSVSLVDSREEAKQILLQAQKRRKDAYIVNMLQWCPNPILKNGYFECQ